MARVVSQLKKMIFTERNSKKHIAAIDIGTNSFHLIVVELLGNGKYRIVDREKENVRLGSGSSDMKMIAPDAIERGVTALKRFSEIAKVYKAPIRAVATSAVREALNQAHFVKKIKDATGINIEVVSGNEEARLIYLGVLQALPVFNHKIIAMDIGGGSVEYIVGVRGEAQYLNSLKIGCIRLTQRFFDKGVIKPKKIQECREYIRGFVSAVAREVRDRKIEFAVGSSGTILNLANMIRANRSGISSDAQLNNFSFTKKELDRVVQNILKAKTVAQRIKIIGLDIKRADIIVAGALVLQESFDLLKIKQMVVSEYALREGIIHDYINSRTNTGGHHPLSNIRYRSVIHLAENFHYDAEHAHQVTRLALSIFDQTVKIHKLGSTEREFLEFAAIMHEVGFFVSHAQHHRHSYYLIRNAELAGFTDQEKEVIANIARYHRKSHPKPKHDGFVNLSIENQRLVCKLAGILRIADGLDRTHSQSITSLRCKIQPKHILIKAHCKSSGTLEQWAVNMKKGLFEESLGRSVTVRIN
ncbi:Ppx/GppA family phosphatase [bacterium]|nr:Ppx/GppA family phosphatase [bacterium]NUN47071.1 Ppx/GppA family phosphatase [bacterium]